MNDEDNTFICSECESGWNTITAADECALLDIVEAKQIRSAHNKRKPWDDGIIRGYD